jgi:hypothetical protein
VGNRNNTRMTTIPSRIAHIVERAIPGVSLWILGALSYGVHQLVAGGTDVDGSYAVVGLGVDQVATVLSPISQRWNALEPVHYAIIVCVVVVYCACVAGVMRARSNQQLR